MSFLIIDTEGFPELKEIAVINESGQLIDHAFCQETRPDHPQPRPLAQIVSQFSQLAHGKILIFHYAEHDLKVLKQAFQTVGSDWLPNSVVCTWELAQRALPNLQSYSLEHLCKTLAIQVKGQYFHDGLAHDASYDATFTYHLYRQLLQALIHQQKHPNPFTSNRVDHPFQHHLDELGIFETQYLLLKSVLQDIQLDPNHQSRGVVLIGEPGSGKTHMIMRMAQQLMQRYRILFIRQPNNPESVFHHIYSRTLESLVQPVDQHYTQLDYLLARSFVDILESQELNAQTSRSLKVFQADPLLLFNRLAKEGTEQRRSKWQQIEKYVLRWWSHQNFLTGASESILKGIIKYCSYTDRNRRDLVIRWLSGTEVNSEDAAKVGLSDWNQTLNPADFALEAMKVFGKLSILDQPLIIVFDQLEALGMPQNRDILLSLGEALKELFTHVENSLFIVNLFPERWEQFKSIFDGSIVDRLSQYQIHLPRPSEEKLKVLLQQRLGSEIPLEALFAPEDLEDIFSQPSIRAVISQAANYYRYRVEGKSLELKTQSVSSSQDPLQARIQRMEADIADLKKAIGLLSSASFSVQLNSSPDPTELVTSEPDFNHSSTLIDYLTQTEVQLFAAYDNPTIITDQDDIGKLRRIVDALQCLKSIDMSVLRLGKRKIPEHLFFRSNHQVIGFLHLHGSSFVSRIKNFNELVASQRDLKFLLLRDARQPPVSGKVSLQEVAKLNHTSAGDFQIFQKQDRIRFELLAQMILDIQNRDLEVDLADALRTFAQIKDLPLLNKILG